jgi:HlyD family secretion protein
MSRKYFFVILILTLFCLSLILYFFGQQGPEAKQEKTLAVRTPFARYVTGSGVVEPQSGNIYIGIPFNRIVKQVHVTINQAVKKGDLLIELDHDDLSANLQVKQQEYEKALANFNKLKALPRQEDLAIAEESIKKAQIALQEAKAQHEMIANLSHPAAIKKEERDRRLYQYQQAEANLKEAQTRFEKVKAGAWQPDLKIAHYQVEQAKADLDALKVEIERTFIRSPIDGTVLQIKIHEGEMPNGTTTQPAIVIGNIDQLNLRVSIDQFNITGISPKASAVAFRQGNNKEEFPLEFIHMEPVMIPKKYVTNAVEEQIDTQVLEILYRIEENDADLFIGEQMDVFIDKTK